MNDRAFAPKNLSGLTTFLRPVRAAITKEIFGQDRAVDAALVALIAHGHILLEGNPGLGKTKLVKTIAGCLHLPVDENDPRIALINEHWRGERAYGRIQFTPDLLPSDITGTEVPNSDNKLEFRHGPIFSWLLLADEINRATPKTQSAMLEAMAEGQVTVLGKRYRIAERKHERPNEGNRGIRPPFTVLATQNPIDQEGTYDLPEAQADRFLFKVRMAPLGRETLARIMHKDAGASADGPGDTTPAPDDRVRRLWASIDQLGKIEDDLRAMPLQPRVAAHIANVVQATNGRFDDCVELADPKLLRHLVETCLTYPLGPRAATALALGAKGFAFLRSENVQNPDQLLKAQHDGLALAILPALRHRLKLKLGWQDELNRDQGKSGQRKVDTTDPDLLRDQLIARIALAAAPGDRAYRNAFESVLRQDLEAGR